MIKNHNYHRILTPISIGVERPDGSNYNVQIAHNLIKDGDGIFGTTGIFSLFYDNFGLDKDDFEDLTGEDIYEIADNKNPDYLGRILFDDDGHWIYDGDLLSLMEQEQIGDFISTYEDGDVDY
jgi:hypothetical protein